MVRELTPKQQRWLAAYLGAARFNATEAAHMAGYAGDRRTLAVSGYRAAHNPRLAAAIKAEEARLHAEMMAERRRWVDANEARQRPTARGRM